MILLQPQLLIASNFLNHQVGCGSSPAIALLIDGDSPTIKNSTFKDNYYGIYIQSGEPLLESLTFGTGEEANECNIYKDGKCINPSPSP